MDVYPQSVEKLDVSADEPGGTEIGWVVGKVGVRSRWNESAISGKTARSRFLNAAPLPRCSIFLKFLVRKKKKCY